METQDEEELQRPKKLKRVLQKTALSPSQTTPSQEMSLTNTSENFKGGKIRYSLSKWKAITNDKHVLNIVCGKVIPFETTPYQVSIPAEIPVSDKQAISTLVDDFVEREIIEPTSYDSNNFYSTIFPRAKSSGEIRFLANMKPLNRFIQKQHFKMESIHDVINAIQPNCYFAKIDLKNAFFTIYYC